MVQFVQGGNNNTLTIHLPEKIMRILEKTNEEAIKKYKTHINYSLEA